MSTAINNTVIRVENLHKVYDSGEVRVHALRGVSLEIERGDFVAIMGTSGSGKSTLMNILGCLDRPTRGQYFLDGVEVSNFSRDQRADIRNRKLGFVFQGYNLLRRTSATENVELPLIYSNVPAAERTRRSLAALRAVGLENKADSQPNQLSGGQQQRVAIARALVNEPSLLLADEPTGNLDSRTSIEVMGVFQRLNDSGMTIVLVTHEPDIAQYAKRVVVAKDGEIILDQPVRKRRSAEVELAASPQTSQFEEVFQ
jgi:putative ABC transport system ATP-binding protein